MNINLLPQNYKDKLKNYKKWNVFLSFELSFLLLCVIATIGFFLLEFYFQSVRLYNVNMLEIERSNLLESEEIKNDIKNFNEIVIDANKIIKEQINISDKFKMIIDSMPNAMNLKSFNILKKNGQINISVIGYAPNNDVLIEFKNKLEKSFAQNISLPLDALTKRKDIDFTINFSLPIQ